MPSDTQRRSGLACAPPLLPPCLLPSLIAWYGGTLLTHTVAQQAGTRSFPPPSSHGLAVPSSPTQPLSELVAALLPVADPVVERPDPATALLLVAVTVVEARFYGDALLGGRYSDNAPPDVGSGGDAPPSGGSAGGAPPSGGSDDGAAIPGGNAPPCGETSGGAPPGGRSDGGAPLGGGRKEGAWMGSSCFFLLFAVELGHYSSS